MHKRGRQYGVKKSLAKARLFCYNMIEYRCESPDEEVNAMRLTIREMEEQYPNQWLGITNEEFAVFQNAGIYKKYKKFFKGVSL